MVLIDGQTVTVASSLNACDAKHLNRMLPITVDCQQVPSYAKMVYSHSQSNMYGKMVYQGGSSHRLLVEYLG